MDDIYKSMQDAAIRIAEERLGRRLPDYLVQNIRFGGWGLIGLEAIIDTVRTVDLYGIEPYLRQLAKDILE
jgi:hypothetical protein